MPFWLIINLCVCTIWRILHVTPHQSTPRFTPILVLSWWAETVPHYAALRWSWSSFSDSSTSNLYYNSCHLLDQNILYIRPWNFLQWEGSTFISYSPTFPYCLGKWKIWTCTYSERHSTLQGLSQTVENSFGLAAELEDTFNKSGKKVNKVEINKPIRSMGLPNHATVVATAWIA